MTVVYRCATCGANFYFYGDQARALRALIAASGQISKEFNVDITTAYKVIELKAKCCKAPLLYRHTDIHGD